MFITMQINVIQPRSFCILFTCWHEYWRFFNLCPSRIRHIQKAMSSSSVQYHFLNISLKSQKHIQTMVDLSIGLTLIGWMYTLINIIYNEDESEPIVNTNILFNVILYNISSNHCFRFIGIRITSNAHPTTGIEQRTFPINQLYSH